MKRIEKEIKKEEDPSSIYDVLPSIPFKAYRVLPILMQIVHAGEYAASVGAYTMPSFHLWLIHQLIQVHPELGKFRIIDLIDYPRGNVIISSYRDGKNANIGHKLQ